MNTISYEFIEMREALPLGLLFCLFAFQISNNEKQSSFFSAELSYKKEKMGGLKVKS